MTLSAILTVIGAMRLLTGTPGNSAYMTKSIALLIVGVGVFVYARSLQRRECAAIARGSMPPNGEL